MRIAWRVLLLRVLLLRILLLLGILLLLRILRLGVAGRRLLRVAALLLRIALRIGGGAVLVGQVAGDLVAAALQIVLDLRRDRKSTRLNSSHSS